MSKTAREGGTAKAQTQTSEEKGQELARNESHRLPREVVLDWNPCSVT